jgi:cytochrome b
MGTAMSHLRSPVLLAAATHHAARTSTGAILLAVLAALLALGCLGWAIARFTSFEPRWARSMRHAMAEAGFRASATWAEFGDWARLGH